VSKYQKTYKEAKRAYYARTGKDYETDPFGAVTIYHLKHGKGKGRYFVGNHLQWLNLE